MSVFGSSQQTSPAAAPVFFSSFTGSLFTTPAAQPAQQPSLLTSPSPVFPQRSQHSLGGPPVFPGAQGTPGATPSTLSASVLPLTAAPLFGSVFPQSVFQRVSNDGGSRNVHEPSMGSASRGGGCAVLDAVPLPQPHATASPPLYPKQKVMQAFNTKGAGAKRGRSGGGLMVAGGNSIGPATTALPSLATSPIWQTVNQQEQRKPLSAFGAAAGGNLRRKQRTEKTGKPASVTVSVKEQLLSTRVFTVFMQKIVDNNESVREEAAEYLEDAFFGVVGSHGGGGDFATALQQMLTVWQTLKKKQPHLLLKGEHWVALFALGCHLNFVSSVILFGDVEQESAYGLQRSFLLQNKWAALTNSCTHANLMCDIMLQLFLNQSESHVPYSVIPFILRRVRNTFDLANDQGVLSIQPNIKTTLLKLHRYVRVPLLQREPQSVVERQRVVAFACVLGEMMLYFCAPVDSGQFIQSFHEHCGNMVNIRCTLYHHHAHKLLQEPLTDELIRQAMELLARAFVIASDDAKENKRLLFVKLSACGLALGYVPSIEDRKKYEITELEDMIVAVQSSNMQLFNLAMRDNSELYVSCGIHNVLQIVGRRIALLMVVKYYTIDFTDRLLVQDMIDYYKMPLTTQEGCHVWLLPLLVERRINGVIDSEVLVLSSANPFDEYKKDALVAFVVDAAAD